MEEDLSTIHIVIGHYPNGENCLLIEEYDSNDNLMGSVNLGIISHDFIDSFKKSLEEVCEQFLTSKDQVIH